MNETDEETTGMMSSGARELEKARGEGPRVAVYSVAVGLASAVPVPFLDRALSGLARGAALRRVAARHGVRLSGKAREILSAASPKGDARSVSRHVLRTALVQLVAPLRIASRIEDALATTAAALLLDHYLATSKREPRAPIDVTEAKRIRDAMQDGAVVGAFDSLRAAPAGVVKAITSSLRAAAKPDAEDRSPAERLVDALLDEAADAPADVVVRMQAAFDRALAGGEA